MINIEGPQGKLNKVVEEFVSLLDIIGSLLLALRDGDSIGLKFVFYFIWI